MVGLQAWGSGFWYPSFSCFTYTQESFQKPHMDSPAQRPPIPGRVLRLASRPTE